MLFNFTRSGQLDFQSKFNAEIIHETRFMLHEQKFWKRDGDENLNVKRGYAQHVSS